MPLSADAGNEHDAYAVGVFKESVVDLTHSQPKLKIYGAVGDGWSLVAYNPAACTARVFVRTQR